MSWAARLAVRLSLVLVLGALGTELLLRQLIWSDLELAEPLRRAWRYSAKNEDEYWKLLYLFGESSPRESTEYYDPLLGWVSAAVEPLTRRHLDAESVGDRRPVLLYGDSFAECTTAAADCFQGLFAESPLSETHWLLNYGVGGYGLDQIYLMLRETLQDWADRDPIVVVGVMVDDDMDRSLLTIRDWPKPRLVSTEDGLVVENTVPESKTAYLEERPVRVTSYLWKGLVQGSSVLPESWRETLSGARAREEAVRRANEPILAAMAELLEDAGVTAFFVAFHGESLVERRWGEWRHEYFVEQLERAGRPWVSARAALDADREATGRAVEDYFLHEGGGAGHYNPLGNRVVFRALLSGLNGSFDGGKP